MNQGRKYGLVFTLIIIVIIGLSMNFLFKQMDSKLTPIVIEDNIIKIANNSYKLEDITDVELLYTANLRGGGGSNTPNTNNGYYKVNKDNFKSRVYIHKNISPFIRVTIKGLSIVFNEDNSEKTYDIYNELVELTKE